MSRWLGMLTLPPMKIPPLINADLSDFVIDPDLSDTFTINFIDPMAATVAGATITANGDGTFNFDPGTAFDSLPEGAMARDTFTYTVTDNNVTGNNRATSNEATLTIWIEGGKRQSSGQRRYPHWHK